MSNQTAWVEVGAETDGGSLPPYVIEAGGLLRQTYALLSADLEHDDGVIAFVYGDNLNRNGLYLKSGAPGVGSWTYTLSLTALLTIANGLSSPGTPTAIATDVAQNGSALTYMRSDGAPAVKLRAQVVASETLVAGNLVNIYSNSGVANMRKANATDATKPAHGFVEQAVTSGQMGFFVYPAQVNYAVTGLTPGTIYYLDTTGGGITATAPATNGNLKQAVGVALSATALLMLSPPGAIVAASTITVSAWIEGVMTATEHVGRYVVTVPFSLPASLTGSYAPAGLTSTGSSAITIKKNGSSIGTINYTASTTNPSFTFASPVSFAAGDVIDFYGAGSADATLGDIGISLLGTLT